MPLDLASADDVLLLTEHILTFVEKKVALRFGIVPLVMNEQCKFASLWSSSSTDMNTATQQAKVFYYLLDSYGHQAALTYLESVGFSKSLLLNLLT